VHTIIRRTIHQYDVNQAVKQGHLREQVQAGSITFVQRFGSSLNLNLHYHFFFLEGVYLDHSAQNLKPKFVKIDPRSDADITAVVTKISQRVIRKLRKLCYLESFSDEPVASGYDPLGDDEPELARTMAASVQQRIAFGERAGQQVRHNGLGLGLRSRKPEAHRYALCPCPWLFPACQHASSRPPPRAVGAIESRYGRLRFWQHTRQGQVARP